MIIGILSGLGAATSQSLSYLGTRHYVQKRSGNASRQLLVLGHIWMGIFSLALLPLVMTNWAIRWDAIWQPLTLGTIAYTSGQLFLVTALRHAEASRVSPLMTVKLIVTGSLVSRWGLPIGETAPWITPMQWFAVILCVLAGISINFTGGRMKRRALLAILCAAISFSLSDWNINLLIKAIMQMPSMDSLHASLAAEGFSYLVTGILALPLLRILGSKNTKDWTDAVPFAAAWFVAMIFLFLAFSSVGILLGSILQCTRGFITILLASLLMYRGHAHIEPIQSHHVILKRLAAGLLMFAGITMYVLCAPANVKIQPPPDTHPRSTACPTTPTTPSSPTASSAKPA